MGGAEGVNDKKSVGEVLVRAIKKIHCLVTKKSCWFEIN